MSMQENQAVAGSGEVAELERALMARVLAAQEALGRTECLDEEQRAEVHAILEAIKHDSQSHAAIVGTYVPEGPHA